MRLVIMCTSKQNEDSEQEPKTKGSLSRGRGSGALRQAILSILCSVVALCNILCESGLVRVI